MTLLEFLDYIAEKALQEPEKYIKPGHNGPYFHPETPLRNKGHWLIIFCKLYEWIGKEAYKSKAAELAGYLLSKEARPCGYSFYHRKAPNKDRCNGLVGQAWTFEALAQAASTFQDNAFTLLAEEVFLQHHFNQKHALWNILEIDGKILPIDNAFNHQLWFAAGISLVNSDHEKIRKQVTSFLDALFDNVTTLESGLIYHEFDFPLKDPYAKIRKNNLEAIKQAIKHILSPAERQKVKLTQLTPEEKKEKLWHKMKHKSIGYHAFNMYAFAMLKQKYQEHPIWSTEVFKKTVNYLSLEEYILGIEDNVYSYAYNPPGYEVPYALSVFQDHSLEQLKLITQEWVNRQIKECYNPATGIFGKNNQDPLTLTARLYEITRLDSSLLDMVHVSDE